MSAGYFDKAVRLSFGQVAAGAAIEVRHTGGGLADIYSNAAMTTPLSNPGVLGDDGRYEFYALFGVYNITVGAGASAATYRFKLDGDGVNFLTRADFVSAVADGYAPAGGTVATIGGLSWMVIPVGHADYGTDPISDLPGWMPAGTATPDHFADNAIQGVTQMGAAINTCLNKYGVCHLRSGTYAVETTITHDNGTLIGNGAYGAGKTTLLGLSSSLETWAAIVKLGRSFCLRGVNIEYDTLTGSETADQRVGLDVRGETYILQRGSLITDIRFYNVGTAISDYGGSVFSVTFGDIEIVKHSYAGVDIRGTGGTGNVWSNIYINGSNNYTPTFGFRSKQRMLGTVNQLNVEHGTYLTAAIDLQDCVEGVVNKAHVEGVDLATGAAYYRLSRANVRFGGLAAINTRMSNDSVSVIELMDTGDVLMNSYETAHNLLHIGTLHLEGLARPNTTLYPSYPPGRTGIHNVTGLKFIKRDAAYTDSDYRVSVDQYQWGNYGGPSAEADIYRRAWDRYSDTSRLDLLKWEDKGRTMQPRKNFVSNGDFSSWASTSLSGITTGTECATGWFIGSSTGSMAASQQAEAYGQDNEWFLRISNVGTVGTYQSLYKDIQGYKGILDSGNMTLSFWMRANVSGRVLDQISMSLVNASGTPTSVYSQVLSGSNSMLDAATGWQYYELPFSAVASSAITTFGPSPVFRLQFKINDNSAAREAQIDLRNVKLERGKIATDFTKYVG